MLIASLLLASSLASSKVEVNKFQIPVMISEGHVTEGKDHGRPVILIASALGVKSEVFRDAFSHVHPANSGSGPTEAEARQNKYELMSRLSQYGITDERLNEVSNYYRYRREVTPLWRHREAVVEVNLEGQKVLGITIKDSGAGYTSEPILTVEGHQEIKLKAKLHFDKAFDKNGSIEKIEQL